MLWLVNSQAILSWFLGNFSPFAAFAIFAIFAIFHGALGLGFLSESLKGTRRTA